ncbi:SDR family NAD(P)-dependent oxidoreductase [Paeniglutamicibacter sulfureus]|uniref:NAD(P)-dependent dehydrogenase (Short-subunit alcohol dehydrogenase family) n=1 Tax=Paeniglutamicibacter sulfureus TaxID=43666 RepID=A0ABU2BLT7_9MICC|nr:SDR family NAD(P)-dependent oxidoreductase [Paeniglutamicibacter sulfureus]MDR7359256.1 NAD(P)-dependent dehydrogenase (short-subunit alcohol dehydrogenase family) [Paeniglutamicibacter sulfureus]
MASPSSLSVTDFAGAGVVVTGATSGLGAATARLFASHGAQVVVCGRNEAKGTALAEEIGGVFAHVDVRDEDSMRAAMDLGARAPRGLRVAVSAAGSAIIEKTLGRSGAHSRASFTDQLETNLVGSFTLLTMAAEAMSGNAPESDGSRGVIALTSSVAAYEGQMGQLAYAASKGGVNAMVLPAARDLARHGIRVLGVAPGVFDTPFMDVLSDEAKSGIGAAVPFPQRLGHAGEFAQLMHSLISNPMLNGEVVRLDGALRLGMR